MQFKKFTSLFLAILLLVSNFGLAFNVHYCGDRIASISSVFSTLEISKKERSLTKDCCCIKEENKNDSCCKNKVVDFKKDAKDVIIKTFSFQLDAPFAIVKTSDFIFAKAEEVQSTINVTEYYCIPNTPPLFKLYQQYIFYA
ncbi:HYC_CC_PP family protein [Flavobacterium sp. SM2513]|uniref:HYC_CC_PP family protein n=1 Tax=Flavobacterium sp. SM2513 TaxID=3424766 RepID=UPI003D7FEE87